MRIQLWSYNYAPEPSGIAPLSAIWAQAMISRGHDVTVVAAHPHYPKPVWGNRIRPYRERRDGVPVVRLPLWIGRRSGGERIRQELSYALSLGAAASLLPPTDVIVAVSPSFPALLPAMATAALRRTPWVMWLQDILPDGAATTGLIDEGRLLDAARAFERTAYGSAARVIVISEAFRRNLLAKGVPHDKLIRVYNPSPIAVPDAPTRVPTADPRQLLVMGNIGHSQGLTDVVSVLEHAGVLAETRSELRIAGHGVAAEEVRSAITTERTKMLGLLFGPEMERELERAALGLVTQKAGLTEFNLPSKLMNYLAHGVPVIAVVDPSSETARLVTDARAGWVVDAARLEDLPDTIRLALSDASELQARAESAHRAAQAHFAPNRIAEQFEDLLAEVTQEAQRTQTVRPVPLQPAGEPVEAA